MVMVVELVKRIQLARARSLAMGLVVTGLFLAGCSQKAEPTGPAAPPPPKDPPVALKILADDIDATANTVALHVLIDPKTNNAKGDELLKYLYRYLMTRTETAPGGAAAYVYNAEAQYKTEPRSPMASVVQKPGDVGPVFENKIPKELRVQIDEALNHSDKGWKLEKKWTVDEAQKSATIVVPHTDTGKDAWSETAAFNSVVNTFADIANDLFEKSPDLLLLDYTGRWKDEDVLKVKMDRATWQKLDLAHVEDQIGQVHGRAFLELAQGKGSDKSVSRATDQRVAGVYKKMLSQIKDKPFVSPKLK